MPVIPSPYAIYSFTTSGQEIVRDALGKLRAVDPDEDLSPSELSGGIRALNRMIDSWNAESLVIPAVQATPFTLSPNVQTYTIGPGATIDAVAPLRLTDESITLSANGNDLPLNVLTAAKWAAILNKNTSGQPFAFHYERLLPFSRLSFYYLPDQSYDITIYGEQLVALISQPQGQFTLQPAYAEALVYGLAIRLAPDYQKNPDASVVAIAAESKANLQRLNIKPLLLETDMALQQRPYFADINSGRVL